MDNLGLKESFVRASREIDVEELEGFVERIFGKVPTELDVTLAAGREGNVRAPVELGDSWCVDDECTSCRHRERVEGDGAVGERRERQPLGGR